MRLPLYFPAGARRRLGAIMATMALIAAPLQAAFAQAPLETVRFQDYPGFGNLLVRVAIAKGLCEKNGLECKLSIIPSSPLGIQALLAGSIDAAFPSVDAVNLAVMRGAKIRYVAGGAASVSLELVAGKHMPTPHAGDGWPGFMQDFKGRKIGVTARGAPIERYMDWMLIKAGLDPEKDVTYVAVGGPNTSYPALVSKQVDALMTYEPVASMCKVLDSCKTIWRGALDRNPAEIYALNGASNGQVFTQDAIDRKPKVVDAVIRMLAEADAFTNDPAHFDEVLRIQQPFFKLEMPRGDEVMAASLHMLLDSNMYRAALNRKAMKAQLDLLLSLKLLTQALPVSDLVLERAP